MKTTLHVFAGAFPSREDATAYSEEQWSPEPGETASDEEYAAWEDDNPRWRLREDLGVYLDSDFIETIHGPDLWSYLAGLLKDENAVAQIRASAGEANTLVLVFNQALGGFDSTLASTAVLTFWGSWPAP